MVITVRSSGNELSTTLPKFENVDFKFFSPYNKKVALYTLEGEYDEVKSAYDELSKNPEFLVQLIEEGDAISPPSTSSIWLWKQVARHFNEDE